jgi:adenylyltransferase/sulfurtransferase
MSGHDRIPPTTDETAALKARIAELEAELAQHRATAAASNSAAPSAPNGSTSTSQTPLSRSEYLRYSRQLLLPQIGLPGQLALKRSRVLIIGLGGLGSPAALYLAGAGIGTIGLVDHDIVEASNLHRQIIHRTSSTGVPKVHSAAAAIRELNPHVQVETYPVALNPENAVGIVKDWDVILDCTDHPKLRYLISDAAVLLGKPLVSASALKLEGQLMVLNDPPGTGPCYRCVWPQPPPPESVVSCGEGGILGPVVGVMGTMQALETIRLLTRPPGQTQAPAMLFFSAEAETPWRRLKMRGRRKGCVACSQEAIARGVLAGGKSEEDYAAFCGSPQQERLSAEYRVDVTEARQRISIDTNNNNTTLLLDVRDETQFGICSVSGSVNVPFSRWQQTREGLPREVETVLETEQHRDVLVLCRLGNDSQIAAKRLMESGMAKGNVWDVKGGIREWARIAPEDGVVEY